MGANIKIGSETKDFQQQMKDVADKLKQVQSNLSVSAEKAKLFGTATDQLKSKQMELKATLQGQNEIFNKQKEVLQSAISDTGKYKDRQAQLTKAIADQESKVKEQIKLTGEDSKEVNSLQTELNKLQREYDSNNKAMDKNNKTIDTLNIKMNETEKEILRTEKALSSSKWDAYSKQMKKASDSMKEFGSKLSSLGNSLTMGVTVPIVGVGGACLKLAMEAQESENLFEVSMGGMAKSARAWSENLSKSLGLNAYELRENVGTFYQMLSNMGQSEKQAYDMSTAMVKLAYDMSSFYNINPDAAFEKIRAGISGESEPLKQLGIIINDTTTQQYALTKGLIKQVPELDKNGKAVVDNFGKVKMHTEEMSEAQKVQARFGLMMQLTTKAQGDLDRTLDSPTNKLRIQKEQLKQQGIEIGNKLIPVLSKALDVIKPIIDKFDKLSDAQKENIIKWAMIAAAAGPVIKILGSGVGTIGKVVGTFGKLSKGIGLASAATEGAGVAATAGGGAFAGLGTAIGGAVIAAAPWLLAAGGIALAGYEIHKSLSKEATPAVDLFADEVERTTKTIGRNQVAVETSTVKISEATKKSVGAYMELDKGAKQSLDNLYLNSTVISENIKNDMVGKYNQMGQMIMAGLNKNKQEQLTNMQDFFSKSDALEASAEASILQRATSYYNQKQTTVSIYEKQINDILSKASSEKRALTESEATTITDIQNRMREEGVKALSKNELEAKTILERMANYDKRLTAEEARDKIQQLNKSMDEAVKAANNEYDKRIATIIKMRDESKIISSDQAEALIKDATRQRDETVNKAEETRTNAVSKMRDMHNEIEEEVDLSTGRILSTWEKLKLSWKLWKPENKVFYTEYKSNATGAPGAARQYSYASGTNYHPGGLARVFDSPSGSTYGEILDLPGGTRVYPHDVSMKMAIEAAKEVARNFTGASDSQSGNIIIPISIAGEEIDRIVAPRVSNRLALSSIGRR